MSEKIGGLIIHKALGIGEKEYDQKFSPDKRALNDRDKQNTENDLENIKRRIIKFIKENIDSVDWQNTAQIDRFCNGIDDVLKQSQVRFIRAQNRVLPGQKEGGKKWQELTAWLSGLRHKTKQEILAELKKVQSIEPSKDASFFEDPQYSAIEVKKIADHNLELPKEDLVTKTRDEEEGKLPKEADEKKDEAEAVDELLSEEVLMVVLKEQTELPKVTAEIIRKLISALFAADPVEARTSLRLLSATITRQERDRIDAEELWQKAESASPENFASLQDSLAFANELLGTHEIELAEAQEQVVQVQQSLALQVLEARTNEVLIEELRRQIAVKEVVQERQESVEKHEKNSDGIEARKERVSTELTHLDDFISALEDDSVALVRWIGEAEEAKRNTLLQSRALANPGQEKLLDRAEAEIEKQISLHRQRYQVVEGEIARLGEIRRQLGRYLEALQLLEQDPPVLLQPLNHEQTEVVLPDIQTIINQALAHPDTNLSSVSTKNQDDELPVNQDALKELPFTVEFSKEQLGQVRDFERALSVLIAQPLEVIRATFPNPSQDEGVGREYYEPLMRELASGEFLPVLKKAIAILGALRTGNEFVARLSKVVGNMILAAGIVKFGAKESMMSSVLRAFLKADMIGGAHGELQLVNRVHVRSAYGRACRLTELGQAASQVWTADLLASGELTVQQFKVLHQRIQQSDQRYKEQNKEKDKLPQSVKSAEEKKSVDTPLVDTPTVRAVEERIMGYAKQGLVAVKKDFTLPPGSSDKISESETRSFQRLIQTLSRGDYLSNLQKALVIFLALRDKEGGVRALTGRDLGSALSRMYKADKGQSFSTGLISDALMQAEILARFKPEISLVSLEEKAADDSQQSTFRLTPFGIEVAKVWTDKLLGEAVFTPKQLAALQNKGGQK